MRSIMRKKNLLGLLCLSCLFIACQDYEPFTKQDMYASQFEQYIGGKIHPEQTWGFHDVKTRSTRGLVDEIDDPFEEFKDIEHLYLEGLPKDIDIEVATNNTPWDQYQQKDGHFQFKDGNYKVNCWNEGVNDPKLFFYITGNVTLDASTIHSVRIYVLPGARLTLTGEPIHNFRVFVSSGGYLEYTRKTIETIGCYVYPDGRTTAAIFNNGTLNFTGDYIDIRSGAIVYNQETMYAKEIDCHSENNTHSYLYNYGDLIVTNDDDNINGDFILDGASNFYNEGNVYVEGSTTFTNSGSHWINKGYYSTQNMNFKGGHGNYDTEDDRNDGAYNFCQLVVRDTYNFLDGTLVLLDNSYIEAEYAIFSNFNIEMWGHAGINIKKGATFAANQDGHEQGFHGHDEKWSYVRLGGEITLPNNSNSFNITGKVVYGIENLKDHSVGNANTAMNIGPDAIEVPFDKIDAVPQTDECYVEWTPTNPDGDEPEYETVRVIVEDLPATITSIVLNESDFDYNDAVFDVTFRETKIDITVHACGGTLPLYVAGIEVHGLFNLPTSTAFINKNRMEKREPITFHIERGNYNNANDIPVRVVYGGEEYAITAFQGEAPAKICVGTDYVWCDEGVDIKKVYPKFVDWAKNNNYTSNEWYK